MVKAFRVLIYACGFVLAGSYAESVLLQGTSLPAPSGTAPREVVASKVAVSRAASQAPPAGAPQSLAVSHETAPSRQMLDRYCVTCHNARMKAGNLVLATMDPERVGDAPAAWEKVVRKLRAGAMPPAGARRPDPSEVHALVSSLETSLDRLGAANPNPGRTSAHRLNRAEYGNAVRDLLALDIDPAQYLPSDDADLGFDNMADILSVSPAFLERSMMAARKLSRLAVGDLSPRPAVTYQIPKLRFQDYRMDEDLPFGSRGGIAVKHYFPADGEYLVKIRLRRNLYDFIRGLQTPQQLEVRLDGERVSVFPVGPAPGRPAPRSLEGASFGSPDFEEYSHNMDDKLEVRFSAKAGPRVVGISFTQQRQVLDGVMQPRPTGKPLATDGGFSSASEMPEAAVDRVTVDGPYNPTGLGTTPSREKIFTCQPARASEEEACAKTILSTIGRRAYRRPLTAEDVTTLLRFYKIGRGEGRFDTGIQRGIESILVDPEFLFRIERDPSSIAPGTNYRVSDLELASRLSFFLWSSIPDDELLDVAVAGKLKDPVVFERQVRRMLTDVRSQALVQNFVGQWLWQRKLRSASPIAELFTEFDDNLREGFQRETELFVESQLREDRSLLDLVRANYTFVNERLARHYGIPNVSGSRFRRVTFKENDVRGGLLGQGSLLTVTSYPNRTSVVVRGHWLLENLLGAAPPPPPPDVPALPDKGMDGKPASQRELLEEHRKNPVCRSCHALMDPLGFSLENFDAIGRWRETGDDGQPVDATGTLPDGTTFVGVSGLRGMVLSQKDQYVGNVTEKLLIYALGRGLEYTDMPVVRQVIRTSAPSDYRWSSVILGIVKSTPFQMRRSES